VVSPRWSSRLRSLKTTLGPKRFFTCEKRMMTSPMGVRGSAESMAEGWTSATIFVGDFSNDDSCSGSMALPRKN
jgi:hypothetical protein